MKKIIYSLLALTILSPYLQSCGQTTEITRIRGKINNYATGEFSARIFPFSSESLQDGYIELSSKIDKHGYFEVETDRVLSDLNSAWATIGQEITRMTITVGDDLFIEVDAKAFDETITYSGKGAERNNHRAKKYLQFEDREMGVNPDAYFDLDFETFLLKQEELISQKIKLLDSVCIDIKDSDYYKFEKQLINNHFLKQLIKHQQKHSFANYEEAKKIAEEIGVNDQEGLFIFGHSKNSIVDYVKFVAGRYPDDLEVYHKAEEVLTGNALEFFYTKGTKPMLIGEHRKQIIDKINSSNLEQLLKDEINETYHQISETKRKYLDTNGNYTVFSNELKKDTFRISGRLLGVDPPKRVTIYDRGLSFKPQLTSQVDSEGNFTLKVPIFYSHDIGLRTGNKFFPLIAHPGDHLYLEIEGKEVTYFGDGAAANQALKEYMTATSSDHIFNQTDLLSVNPDDLKKEVIATYEKDKAFNEKYFSNKDLPILKIYADNKIMIENFGALAQFDSYRKYRSKKEETELMPLPDDFYDFEGSYLDLQPKTFLNSEAIFVGQSRAFRLYAEATHLSPTDQLGYVLDHAKDILSTTEYDVFFTQTMNSHLSQKDFEIIDPFIIRYQKDVSFPWIVNEFITNYKREKEIFAGLVIEEGTDLNNDPKTSGDSLLAAIVKKHEGKAIYIDIWATWCGPCVGEFSFAKEFHQALDKKKVATVYLAGHSKENAWKSMISEHKLKGDHYLLTTEQYEEIASKFESQGFPHYAIIDPNGIIKYKNAPRPSLGQQKLNEGLVDILNNM